MYLSFVLSTLVFLCSKSDDFDSDFLEDDVKQSSGDLKKDTESLTATPSSPQPLAGRNTSTPSSPTVKSPVVKSKSSVSTSPAYE